MMTVWLKGQIQDKGAYTGRVGYTHRPCGQGQALSDPIAIESSKSRPRGRRRAGLAQVAGEGARRQRIARLPAGGEERGDLAAPYRRTRI